MLRHVLLVASLLGFAVFGCAANESSDPNTIRVDPHADSPTQTPTEGGGDNLVIGDDTCETDADCVPAGCCHAAACVGVGNQPDCTDAMCTQECRYGTLDCGGRCLCHEGRCAARLSEPPVLPE